jgi:hypothetical protein
MHRLVAQGASLRQYIAAGIPIFHSSFRFLHLFHTYLCLPISFLAISTFLDISISLHYTENKNNSKGANYLLCFAYSLGHFLKIVFQLAEQN